MWRCTGSLISWASAESFYFDIVGVGRIIVFVNGHGIASSKQCPLLLQSVLFDSLTNLHSSFGFGAYTTHTTPTTADPFRPYVCHTCGKRFKLNHHLKQHSRIHTGERPFACNLCGKTFTQQSSYHYHIKKKLCGPNVPKLDVASPTRSQSGGSLASGSQPEMPPLQSRVDSGVGLSTGMQSDIANPNLLLMNLTGSPTAMSSGMHSDMSLSSGIPSDMNKVPVTLPSMSEPAVASGIAYDTTMSMTSTMQPDMFEPTVSHS